MKIIILSLFLVIGACSKMSFDKTVKNLDLNRFMGKWYVVAARPTFFEQGAHNSIEEYTWNELENRIDVNFTFRQDSFDGALKTIKQKAWVYNKETNAHWKIQIIWPFKLDYLVIDIDENYNWVVIGVPGQRYVWIMSRDWKIPKETIDIIINRIDKLGYDTKDISIIAHKWD